MSAYLVGTDVLGAGEQYLVIRVRNLEELVRKRGGFAGGLAVQLAPKTIENKVYSEMAREMVQKFREQGVDAEVSITSAPPTEAAARADFIKGAFVGAGLLAFGRLAVWLIAKR